jgi:crossover junction endodeoxyribonuclease RuvC
VRILGIDPGLRVTGFGVIEQTGSKLRYITSGCVRSGGGELALRLKTILEGLAEVIAANRPQEISIEKVFVTSIRSPRCCWARRAARRSAPR